MFGAEGRVWNNVLILRVRASLKSIGDHQKLKLTVAAAVFCFAFAVALFPLFPTQFANVEPGSMDKRAIRRRLSLMFQRPPMNAPNPEGHPSGEHSHRGNGESEGGLRSLLETSN